MNMEFVEQLAHGHATVYAQDKPGEKAYLYSAYFAGYMRNAWETQALRQIVRRLEMKEGNAKVPSISADKLADYGAREPLSGPVVIAAPTPPPIKTEDFY